MNFNRELILKLIEETRQQTPKSDEQPYLRASGAVITDADKAEVIDAVLGGWFTEGPKTHEFIQSLRQSFDPHIRMAIPTNSGSSANLLAITAVTQPEFGSRALRPGDEVITAAVGFPTTISGMVQNGLVPVFTDINLPTYVPDAEDIEAAIGDRTKAIMLAHTLGNPFDLEKIRQVADENNLLLIGDACDALGSKIGGISVGTLEDIATLSFYPAHHITIGEGGAVLTNSPMVAKVVESLRSWGRSCWCETGKDNTCGKRFCQPKSGSLPVGYDHKYTYSRLGYNLKITDMQAALGVSQLRRLPEFTDARKHNHKRLYDGLLHLDDYFHLPVATKGSEPSWFGFCITLRKNVPFTRNEIIDYLESHKVGTRLLFGGNLLRQPGFQRIQHRVSGKLYNSDVVTECSFWVGCWPGLSDADIDYMLGVFEDFIRLHRKK